MTNGPADGSDTGASLRGRLVVATPRLVAPPFRRGVVLNKPTRVKVSDVLPAWTDLVSPPDVVFSGGPVSTDAALAVGTVAPNAPGGAPLGWQQLYDSTGLVNLDTPPQLVAGALQGLRIFAGYAGWGASQLEGEIEEGAWYVVDAESSDLYGGEPDDLWRRVLRRQVGELAIVASFPDDPRMN
jgi:putative transcriptional regulator